MSGFGLYVHWPWCTRICPYCDFNVYKAAHADGTALTGALLAHLDIWRELSGARELTSIHFGGGTPSLMTPEQIGAVIAKAARLWSPRPELEVGLEANPSNAEDRVWRGYRAAGVNRLSLGVQSFDDAVLKQLGRDHDGAGARAAAEMAREIFDNVSLDLIFGHAGQTLAHWQSDLDTAMALTPDHLSLYQLTIEQKTAFGQRASRGEVLRVDEDNSADLYDLAVSQLSGRGFEAYEVSNFAKAENKRSAHNQLYWSGGDYAGIGPGAHGRLTRNGVREAFICDARPVNYIQSVGSATQGFAEIEALSANAAGEEYVLMGLRHIDGISLSRFHQISGADLPEDRIRDYQEMGLLLRDGDRLKATPEGRLVLDTLSHQLLAG